VRIGAARSTSENLRIARIPETGIMVRVLTEARTDF
jgi:hypothetical protein